MLLLSNISKLMEHGKPVSIVFTDEKGKDSPFLYCELIQKARWGSSFLIKSQGCRVGEYVFGNTESPHDYYYASGRYKDKNAAKNAVSLLSRLKNQSSIKITPYDDEKFDVLILFLKPEKAMRIVQAYAYNKGCKVELKIGGTASICSECTAYPYYNKLGISLGCKGSRKHSKYPDDELIVGIPFELVDEIEDALGKIPLTFS